MGCGEGSRETGEGKKHERSGSRVPGPLVSPVQLLGRRSHQKSHHRPPTAYIPHTPTTVAQWESGSSGTWRMGARQRAKWKEGRQV